MQKEKINLSCTNCHTTQHTIVQTKLVPWEKISKVDDVIFFFSMSIPYGNDIIERVYKFKYLSFLIHH